MKKIEINNINIPIKKKDINKNDKTSRIIIRDNFYNEYSFDYDKTLIPNILKIKGIEIIDEYLVLKNEKEKKFKISNTTIVDSENPFLIIEIIKNKDCKIFLSKRIFKEFLKFKTINFL